MTMTMTSVGGFFSEVHSASAHPLLSHTRRFQAFAFTWMRSRMPHGSWARVLRRVLSSPVRTLRMCRQAAVRQTRRWRPPGQRPVGPAKGGRPRPGPLGALGMQGAGTTRMMGVMMGPRGLEDPVPGPHAAPTRPLRGRRCRSHLGRHPRTHLPSWRPPPSPETNMTAASPTPFRPYSMRSPRCRSPPGRLRTHRQLSRCRS
mmetsp:Transcript_151030/g.263923  ORF Transcript_151030/g.263923 Transcript_151030/m.263923 type:complete len:202 (+) Transcript_151030:174-779(+)